MRALDEQHVVVVGTSAAGIVLPELACMLAGIHEARAKVLTRVETLVEAHPLHRVLTSMPVVGVRTAARILTDVVGKDFPTAGRLASYAGLAPVTWRSSSSIRGDHSSRRGNKALKGVLSSPSSPHSRTDLPGLLRPQTFRRQTPQPGPRGTGPKTLRYPLRHAQRRHPLRPSRRCGSLTELERLARSHTAPAREVRQAKALLWAAAEGTAAAGRKSREPGLRDAAGSG
ncbi:MAG: insertion element uncharacterized 43 [Arthrobacter sp.]|nr:insertion element uncharacterized 43 [Arthrobacter sp.]